MKRKIPVRVSLETMFYGSQIGFVSPQVMFRTFSDFEQFGLCFHLDISSVRRNPHARRGTVAVSILLLFYALPACGRQASVCLKIDSCASCLGDRGGARAPSHGAARI